MQGVRLPHCCNASGSGREGNVGEHPVARLPGTESGVSLAAGTDTRAAGFCNPRIRKHHLWDSPAFTKVTLDPAAVLSSAAARASAIRVSVVATRFRRRVWWGAFTPNGHPGHG